VFEKKNENVIYQEVLSRLAIERLAIEVESLKTMTDRLHRKEKRLLYTPSSYRSSTYTHPLFEKPCTFNS
jgi:hypothetical protein